jgi:serine protease Do
MRKHMMTAGVLMAIVMLPSLLDLNLAQAAAQRWEVEPSQGYGIPSEDTGTSAYLGVDIVDITGDRLGALKLKEEQGVEVTMVDQDAPAGKAGIKEHDVILTMNGTAIESKTQLQRMIHETPPGRVVTLGLSRDGQPETIKLQLADRRNEFASLPKDRSKDIHIEIPPIPNLPDLEVPNIGVVYVHSSMRSGLMVENLTPQLGEFFGARNGNGVLVRSVEKGSRAEHAGLRAGDVITRVGEQPVSDTSDFSHALRSHSAGAVNVSVIRDKKELTLTLTLPEHKESGEMKEESLELPDADAEAEIEVSEVQDEIATLRPQLELATEEARTATEEMQKVFCAEQAEMMEQSRKLKEELAPQLREEWQKSREKLQEKMEEFRRRMAAESFDI